LKIIALKDINIKAVVLVFAYSNSNLHSRYHNYIPCDINQIEKEENSNLSEKKYDFC
jgi:hypothetical protein